MVHIKDFTAFLNEALSPARTVNTRRHKFLVDFNAGSGKTQPETYAIRITFDDSLLLTEHQHIQQFQRSQNRYYYHPEETHPAVEAHYHIIGPRGKQELYSVTMSGKAHHKVNRGYQIPRREADELRMLGVAVPTDNIIESIELAPSEQRLLLESLLADPGAARAELLVIIERE